jgi:hypothetical protein
MRYLFALFLLAHGMVHALWLAPAPAPAEGKQPWPFRLETSPVLTPRGVTGSALRSTGTALIVAVIVAFTLSALGAAGVNALVMPWPTITLIASVLSVVLTLLFWDPQLPAALIIDAVLILTILGNWWPANLVP